MGKKIRKALTSNIGYKLLALLLACVLWVVVYNLDDPAVTRTFTATVTVVNSDAVAELNKTYEIESNTVTFRVQAARSYIEKLEDSDFTAVADMNNLVLSEDQSQATVPITISSDVYSRYLTYRNGTQYLTVTLEDLMSRQFSISASTIGEPAEGYVLGTVAVQNPNVLTVSGPASLVGAVDRVEADIDVDGMSSNLSNNVIPVLLDAKGGKVDTTRLSLSSETVTITASILPTKEVFVSFTPEGTPAEGYEVTDVSCDPSLIKVKGASSLLNGIFAVEIPSEVLSAQGADTGLTTTVDISEYLPDGVEIVDEGKRTVTISVKVEGIITKQVAIPAENIEIIGIGEGMEAQLAQSSVAVTITGLAGAIEDIGGEDLTGSVDVSGLKEGEWEDLPFIVTASDLYEASAKTVTVILTKSGG